MYEGHKTLANMYMVPAARESFRRVDGCDWLISTQVLGLTTLFIGLCWGLPMWSIQTARGGSGSNCDAGIYVRARRLTHAFDM